jgi:hypothetical protein
MDLKAACFEAAGSAKWERRPQPVEDIQKLADKFYARVSEGAKEIHEINEDSQIVNRALHWTAIPLYYHAGFFHKPSLSASVPIYNPSA